MNSTMTVMNDTEALIRLPTQGANGAYSNNNQSSVWATMNNYLANKDRQLQRGSLKMSISNAPYSPPSTAIVAVGNNNSNAGIRLAEAGEWEHLEHRLAREPHLAQQQDHHGMMPLHWACTENDVPPNVIDALLRANPSACQTRNNAQFIPLHIAVRSYAQPEILRLLCEADPSTLQVKTSQGKNALDLAVETNLPYESLDLLRRLEDAYVAALRYQRSQVPQIQQANADKKELDDRCRQLRDSIRMRAKSQPRSQLSATTIGGQTQRRTQSQSHIKHDDGRLSLAQKYIQPHSNSFYGERPKYSQVNTESTSAHAQPELQLQLYTPQPKTTRSDTISTPNQLATVSKQMIVDPMDKQIALNNAFHDSDSGFTQSADRHNAGNHRKPTSGRRTTGSIRNNHTSAQVDPSTITDDMFVTESPRGHNGQQNLEDTDDIQKIEKSPLISSRVSSNSVGNGAPQRAISSQSPACLVCAKKFSVFRKKYKCCGCKNFLCRKHVAGKIDHPTNKAHKLSACANCYVIYRNHQKAKAARHSATANLESNHIAEQTSSQQTSENPNPMSMTSRGRMQSGNLTDTEVSNVSNANISDETLHGPKPVLLNSSKRVTEATTSANEDSDSATGASDTSADKGQQQFQPQKSDRSKINRNSALRRSNRTPSQNTTLTASSSMASEQATGSVDSSSFNHQQTLVNAEELQKRLSMLEVTNAKLVNRLAQTEKKHSDTMLLLTQTMTRVAELEMSLPNPMDIRSQCAPEDDRSSYDFKRVEYRRM